MAATGVVAAAGIIKRARVGSDVVAIVVAVVIPEAVVFIFVLILVLVCLCKVRRCMSSMDGELPKRRDGGRRDALVSSRYATGSWSRATERYGRHGAGSRSACVDQCSGQQVWSETRLSLSTQPRAPWGDLQGRSKQGKRGDKLPLSRAGVERRRKRRRKGERKGKEKETEKKKNNEQKNRGWREHDGLGRSAAVLLIWVGSAKPTSGLFGRGVQSSPATSRLYRTVEV